MVDEPERLMLKHRPGLSRHDDLAKAMDYMLKRWPAFTPFLDDGRVCLTNNAAERALRGVALAAKPGCSPAPIVVGSGLPSCKA
jgi:transposase